MELLTCQQRHVRYRKHRHLPLRVGDRLRLSTGNHTNKMFTLLRTNEIKTLDVCLFEKKNEVVTYLNLEVTVLNFTQIYYKQVYIGKVNIYIY